MEISASHEHPESKRYISSQGHPDNCDLDHCFLCAFVERKEEIWNECCVSIHYDGTPQFFLGEIEDCGIYPTDNDVEAAMITAESLQFTSFFIEKTNITREGFTKICEALKTNPHITSFYTRNPLLAGGERLGDWGAGMLADVMKSNTRIDTIDLPDCDIGDEGAIHIASAISDPHTSLDVIDLSDNGIGDEGGIALANSLRHNKTVKCITVFSNYIGDPGATAFAEMLKTNTTLETLIILGNSKITQHGGELLYGAIAFNDTLKDISVDQKATPSEYVGLSLEEVRQFSTAIEHG